MKLQNAGFRGIHRHKANHISCQSPYMSPKPKRQCLIIEGNVSDTLNLIIFVICLEIMVSAFCGWVLHSISFISLSLPKVLVIYTAES